MTERARQIVRTMVERFAANDILTAASAVAFQLLVALVPLALLGLVVMGFLGLEDDWRNEVAPQVREGTPAPVTEAIFEIGNRIVTDPRVLWLVVAALVTLWEISGSVRAVMGASNRIYAVDETRPTLRRFAVSIALAAGVAVCVIGAALAVMVLPERIQSVPSPLAELAGWVLGAALLWVVVVGMLAFAPARHQPVRWIGGGAVLILVSWIAVSLAFRYYVTNVARIESAFGIMTALLVLTGYLYASSITFLVGMQVDALLRDDRERERLLGV